MTNYVGIYLDVGEAVYLMNLLFVPRGALEIVKSPSWKIIIGASAICVLLWPVVVVVTVRGFYTGWRGR